MDKQEKIVSIDSLRGIASLMVCVFHLSCGNERLFDAGTWMKTIGSYGFLGVEIFFVISGLVIPLSLYQNNYQTSNFFRFLWKRSVRIEPPYLLSIILVLVLNYVAGLTSDFQGSPQVINYAQVLSHIAYLPTVFGFNWLQPVYWTLMVEFQYYILLGLSFFLLVNANRFIGLGYLALLLLLSGYVHIELFNVISLFILGMLYFFYLKKMIRPGYVVLLMIPVLLHIYCFLGMPVLLSALFALLFIHFVRYRNRVFVFLGSISYSLYLTHVVIGGKIVNIGLRYVFNETERMLVFCFALVVSLIFAWLFCLVIEKPAIRWSKKITYN